MKIFDEKQILDEGYRREVIEEIIKGTENIARREEALKRHEVYRDKNSKWVMKAIENEGFKKITVEQMRNRCSNVSIARKIVNKLAQTYTGGVDREAPKATEQDSFDLLTDELDMNTKFKKADRYRQLQKNCMMQIVPVLDTDETIGESKKYFLAVKVLAPWEYDVIEDAYDRECAKVVILSDFLERTKNQFLDTLAGSQGQRLRGSYADSDMGDGRDERIADNSGDQGAGLDGSGKNRQFIFWSTNYHITCYANGKKVPDTGEEDDSNPIKTLPFVNFAMDQDGAFWAVGGSDVTDGSVLVNKELTDLNFIAFTQGFGQLVIDATNPPKKIEGGPDNAFIFKREDGQAPAAVFYASSNPPIKDWLDKIMSYVRMLLTTNNLSAKAISATADIQRAASGIAMIIDDSEIMTDLKDVQVLFQDKEPEVWNVIMKWHSLYSDKQALIKALQDIPKFTDPSVKIKFHSIKPPVSETDELTAMGLRQKLGIVTLKDLVKQDNPDLSDEDAQEKVMELQQEKMKNRDMFSVQPTPEGQPDAKGATTGGTPTPQEDKGTQAAQTFE